MYLHSHVLFLLLLPGGARRSIRIDDSHHSARQQSNTLADGFEVSVEAREAFIPKGFGTGISGHAGPQAGALRVGFKQIGQPAGHRRGPEVPLWPAFHQGDSPGRSAPWLLFGPRRAKVALQAGTGPEADQLPSKEQIVAQAQQITNDKKQIISSETYGLMLSRLLNTTESVPNQISANYPMIDYAFLQRLDELEAEGKPELAERLAEIRKAINKEMAARMQAAAEAMKDLVQSPTPVIMEGKIAGLARQGRLDDALMQLLDANLQQAQLAGDAGKGAVAVLSKLKTRVQKEVDAKLAPEVTLIRQLLRMDDPQARQELLRAKMKPKKSVGRGIILNTIDKADREDAESTEPEVPPRLLAKAIQEIKRRFGNVDENYDTGFVKRLQTIAEEAESIALELADGKEITAQQAQDQAWEREFVSVWDLGQIEEQAHQDGNFAVWEEEAQAQMARQDQAMRKKAIDGDWKQ